MRIAFPWKSPMNEHAMRRMLEGGGGWPGAMLRAGLWIPGKAYGGLMRLRRSAYRRGLLSSVHPGVPVISVGNLTAGGSGKTPFTVLLAEVLSGLGVRPGILLRGYRSSTEGLSDEAALYACLCPDALVETGSDRRASARRAVAAGAQALIMDDGMQHLRLRRDLDIVLVDATSPWGGGNTLPGGLLREPKSAMRHAGVVVVTRANQAPAETVAAIIREIRARARAALVLTACHRPARLYRLDNTEIPLSALRGRKAVALSGIARPEAFEKTLGELGADVVASFAGSDHEHYDKEFVGQAIAAAEKHGAVVVTTEKDRAKQIFSDYADNNNVKEIPDIWTLGIRQAVDGEEKLRAAVSRIAVQMEKA